MTTKDAIRTALGQSQMVLTMLLDDLSDADLVVRSVPGANTIAWQLGHVIQSEMQLHKHLGVASPELPAGFAENHSAAAAKDDSTAGRCTKAEYVRLYQAVRAATLAGLDAATDATLATKIEGPIARIAPTVGDLILLMASHGSFHAGQFSIVRRKLGKPVLF